MANYSKLPGQRGDVYWFEGFVYYKDKLSTDGKKWYLKCKDKLPNNGGICGGRAVLLVEGDTMNATRQHSHPAQSHEEQRDLRLFRAQLKKTAEECSSGLLRESYDQVASNFPEAATLLPFSTVERTKKLDHFSFILNSLPF